MAKKYDKYAFRHNGALNIILTLIMGLMVSFGNELILCSDKGVMYSTSRGSSWFRRR